MVIAEGRDAVRFLDDLLSQEVAGLPVGAVARSLLLGPQGKLRALLWLLRGEERVAMVADAGVAQTVLDDLTQYMIRVKLSLRLDERPIVDLIGPASEEVLARAGLDPPPGWSDEQGDAGGEGAAGRSSPVSSWPGRGWLVWRRPARSSPGRWRGGRSGSRRGSR